jgi:hypothetical protein
MICYHGTTRRRAQRISEEGFLPRRPSRRVWFAESRAYALTRAKTQARRSDDRPVVLACDLDLNELRRRLGGHRVMHRSRIIAVDGPVPQAVLRTHLELGVPSTPRELTTWLNQLLGLKQHKGVSRTDPGVERLSRWIANRRSSQPWCKIRPTELLRLAQQWLPDYFQGFEVSPGEMSVHRTVTPGPSEEEAEPSVADLREREAVDALVDARAKSRIRGLEILADIEEPDLFDWCAMLLDDESVEVRLASLRTMLRCEAVSTEPIRPLASSENKRIRATAVAVLAHHSARTAWWFEYGLKDPAACVRLATAALLPELDPERHRGIFELALSDPNPKVAQTARRITAGKGFQDVLSLH